MVNRIRANNYNLNESLERKEYIETSRCECGAKTEDVNHLIFRCKNHDEEREFMFRKMEKKKIKLWLNVDEFIKNKQWRAMEIIYQFLKKTGKQL